MEICCVGGFEEVGKNMTAVKIKEDVFIFDCGFFLPGVIELQEEPDKNYNLRGLRRVGGIPDERVLDKLGWRSKVKGIFLSHAHLDHIGGLPYLVDRYPHAQIFGTPFTIEVLKSLVRDSGINMQNPIKVVNPNSIHKVKEASQEIKVEFVHATHSTIDCAFIALHTNEGVFFYALDLKFDNYPTMGKPPNYKRFKKLGEKGVNVLIVDSLYSHVEKKHAGETVARHLLEDAFSKSRTKSGAIFVTTFSSHIERLNNIVKIGQKTNREIVFLGRSLAKYVGCAIRIGKCPFKKKIRLIKYKTQVNSFLKKVNKDRGRYLVVCTGHQGEEGSILDRVSRDKTSFRFKPGDHVIFSSSVIPTEVNIASREKLDQRLRRSGVKLQTDVHVHGHGSREDLREILEMLKPKHIIPAHGSLEQERPMIELSKEYGYKEGKTAHLVHNGEVLNLK